MMGVAVQTCNYTQGESNSDDGVAVTIPRERETVMMGAAVAAFLVGKGFSLCPPQVGCFMQRYSRHTSVNWATMLATSGVGLPATSTYRENLLFLKYELNIAPNQHKSRFQTSLCTVSDYKHFRISSWISSIQLWISLESAQDQLRISSGSVQDQLRNSSVQAQFKLSSQAQFSSSQTYFKHSCTSVQNKFKLSSSSIQTQFKHTVFVPLFKISSSSVQAQFKLSSSIVVAQLKISSSSTQTQLSAQYKLNSNLVFTFSSSSI